MALRVWLPLNGNVNNKGASNSSITINGATVDNSGKIGKCYSFNGSSNYITGTHNFISNSTEDWSYCCWVKFNNVSNTMCLFSARSSTSTTGITIFTGSNWLIDDGERWTLTPKTAISASNWYHVCVTRTKSSKKLYINGALDSSTTTTGTPSTVCTTNYMIAASQNSATSPSGNYLNGYLNDARFYDQCLSEKEIKEISKGLVLHYPFDSNGIGAPNLCLNTTTFSGWSVGSGWTLGTSDDGTKMYSFSRTGATGNNWVRIIPTLRVDGNNYPNGITVSMDILTPDKSAINQKCLGALQQYNESGSRTGWYEPGWDLTNVVDNQWSRIKFTFSKSALLTNSQGLVYAYTMFSFQLVQNGNISIRKIKIEEGNTATPYTVAETEYSSGLEIDTSGLGNNGTRTGTLTGSKDTPRYQSSLLFSNSSYITYKLPPNMYYATYSFWMKFASFTNYGMINGKVNDPASGDTPWFSCNTESSQLWCYFGGNSPNYTRAGSGTLVANTWYHCAYVWNNGVAQWYLNGAKLGSAVTYTGKKYIPNSANISIGDSYTGSSWSGTPFNGQLSDFRVYATALSDADIAELYKVSSSIDNKGSMYCLDFSES